MSTYTSEVQIVNSALIKLGLDPITSLSEINKSAKFCSKQYPILRDEVLYSHPWNFAIVRVQLAKTVNTPAFEYTYEYALPSDVLRVLGVSDNEDGLTDYVIEYNSTDGNRVLLTDESAVKIKYVRCVKDVTQFTPTFGEVLSMRLAMDLAGALTDSNTKTEFWARAYDQWIKLARSFDAQEGSARQVVTSTWKNARY